MKKIIGLLFLASTLITCETEPLDPSLNGGTPGGGSGSGGGTVTASIVGDWDYDDYVTNTTVTVTVMGNTVTSTSSNELVSASSVLSFNSDGTYTLVGDQTFEIFLQGISQGNQTISINDSGTYVVNGSDLDLVPSSSQSSSGLPQFGQDADFTIDTLTATDLVILINSDTTQNVNGATQRIEVDGFGDFTRQ